MNPFLLDCFTRNITRRLATFAVAAATAAVAVVASTTALAHDPTPLPGIDPTVNEQVLMLPVVDKGKPLQFETTLFKPPGEGPFPLLVMNHGKDRGSPADQHRDRFLALSREFVKRGYAVAVPMRKGFSKSTGIYADFGCSMKDNGQQQADDVQAALDALVRLPYIDRDRILIAGQSYGGLATLAFGTRHYPGVRGLINFAGGLRIDGSGCDWKNSLIKAAGSYGAQSSLPGLWFYGENDSYFNHALAQQMQAAYQAGGGAAQLVAYGHFKGDAHGMVGSRDGVAIWLPETERFLKSLGMPADEVVAIADTPRPSPSGYAPLTSVDAVPNLSVQGKDGYREYLSKGAPRAFAISGSGAWSWAEEGDDPSERALQACQKNSRLPCLLYAVDNDVVWSDPRLSTVPPLSTQ